MYGNSYENQNFINRITKTVEGGTCAIPWKPNFYIFVLTWINETFSENNEVRLLRKENDINLLHERNIM